MKILLAGILVGKGGIQSNLRWLSRALGEEGVEVLALSLGSSNLSPADLGSFQHLQAPNVHFVSCKPYSSTRLNPFIFSKLGRLTEIVSIVKQFSPDVYLAHGIGWNLFVPSILSGVRMRRVFYEGMSGVPFWRFDPRLCARWGFDEVVGQDELVAETFAKSFGWKKPISVIPAMPEPLEVTASLPQVTPKSVGLGKARAALFSRLAHHKQAFWLVQQWELLKEVLSELHFHGSGPEEPLIREYIEKHDLGDRVKCFGPYPDGQDYVDLLSSYDLTLLPTIGAEASPLVLLESMACGVPFVAYGVGGIPAYGVDNPNVSIVPVEPDAFVLAIKGMVSKLAEGKINQAQLQKYYFDRYSYQVLKHAWVSYLCN
jgi:glycosyltransferase involved in cell wall biosynthesis